MYSLIYFYSNIRTDRHDEGVYKYGRGSHLHILTNQRASENSCCVGRKCELKIIKKEIFFYTF